MTTKTRPPLPSPSAAGIYEVQLLFTKEERWPRTGRPFTQIMTQVVRDGTLAPLCIEDRAMHASSHWDGPERVRIHDALHKRIRAAFGGPLHPGTKAHVFFEPHIPGTKSHKFEHLLWLLPEEVPNARVEELERPVVWDAPRADGESYGLRVPAAQVVSMTPEYALLDLPEDAVTANPDGTFTVRLPRATPAVQGLLLGEGLILANGGASQ